MKKFLDIPALWRSLCDPLHVSYRLNTTIGYSVWQPRPGVIFFAQSA